MKKIKLVSVSAQDETHSFFLNTASWTLDADDSLEISTVSNNRKPLAEVYNRYLNEDHKDYIVVFVHDDVYLADGDLARKCREAAKMFDVFGVAGGYGGLNIEPAKPALWHLISKKHAGFAGHYDESTKNVRNPFTRCWMTSFGPTPQETILVDGVFLGVHVEKALQNNLRFDEACPSAFHFYDLLFCVNAKKKGMKVGVFPFNVFHQSPGLKEYTKEFLEGDLYFKEYCAKLLRNDS